MKKEKKSETIVFRTTAEQKQNIGTLANEKGISPSKWIYEALGRTIKQEQLITVAPSTKEVNPWFIALLFAIGTWFMLKLVRTSQAM